MVSKSLGMVIQTRWMPRFFATSALCLVVACAGGGMNSAKPTDLTYTIGGSLSGLAPGQSVTLQNNGVDTLKLLNNGSFTFSVPVLNYVAYSVTVTTPPNGQRCTVSLGEGRAVANVTNIEVRCQNLPTNTFTLGGTVSGLGAGKSVVLQNNGQDDLTISANGGFTFATALAANSTYAVTIKTNPAGQSCSLSQASGTVLGNVSSVTLTCQDTTTGTIKPLVLADSYREDRAGILIQANTQGANGYAYLTGYAVTDKDFINLYVKDLATTYSWEALDPPSSGASLEAQLNAQGARGFAHHTFLLDSVLYMKDAIGLAPFLYELWPSQTTSAGFLSQANVQGAKGFFFLGEFLIGGTTVAIYGKDSSNARYSYLLQSPISSATPDSFVMQANSLGQQGYRFMGERFYSGNPGNESFKAVYLKDTTQTATFEFKTRATTIGVSSLLTQTNAEGQLGYVFYGPTAFFPNGFNQPSVTRNLYFKPTNCTGTVLCRPTSPLK